MNCEQFELRWNELLDLRERPQADAQLQGHVQHCVDCRSLAAAQEAVLEAIAASPLPEQSGDLTEKILAQVHVSRSAKQWTMLKIVAALTTAAAITVACWPALFAPEVQIAQPRQLPAESPPVVVATPPQPVVDSPSAINPPPISALAQEASARYQELARETRDWPDFSRWVPSLGVSLTSNAAPNGSSAAADWMGEVTTGLEPLRQSTSATLQSLMQALPGEASVSPSEERAS